MELIKRWAYGAAFCFALPLALALWARQTSSWVQLPVPGPGGPLQAPVGWTVAASGLVLMGAAMADLFFKGGGLPMNAFPPKRLVRRGVYGWVPEPIYVGAVTLSAGVSMALDSASGFWLVTPVLGLGAATLTWGYERHDLLRRFGELPAPLLGLPIADGSSPTLARRLGTLAFVVGLWLLVFEATVFMPAPPDGISTYFASESTWPMIPWTELIYASAYVAVPAAFFVPRTSRGLRRFAASGLIATGVMGLLWWTLPFVAPPRSLTPFDDGADAGLWVQLMAFERTFDNGTGMGAFPSFHALWALLSASVLRGTRWAPFAWVWAMAVGVSCVTTGMHAAIDIAAGWLVFLLVDRRAFLWSLTRASSERLANAWREWRIGPVRIINHGFFGGAAGMVGCLIVCQLLGNGGLTQMWILGLASIVTAGLWAQIIEGESVSLRPFGYYGAVVGFVLGGAVLALLGHSPMNTWGAFAVASPMIQAFGRCRCLIQGCCHGGPAAPNVGITVTHPRSRVVKLSDLAGRPIHATQTYSILWNVICTLTLFRLWSLGVPAPALVGAYLILAGAGRFVEESYRAEPQTPRVLGLAIYQWNATLSFLAGIAFTMWPGDPLPATEGLTGLGAASSMAFGIVIACLMGVDLPDSKRRFARLTK